MGFEGFGLEDAKVRTGGETEWIGPGNHRLKLTKLKQRKGDTFAEFEVIETRDRGDQKTPHRVGDKLAEKFATGGTGKQTEMALSDFKTFLAAFVKGAGRDPMSIAAAQWVPIANRTLEGDADGMLVDCGAWKQANKETGELYHIPKKAWIAVEQEPRPKLFEGFGFATQPTQSAKPATDAARPVSKPGPRPTPATQAADPKKIAEVTEAVAEWKSSGMGHNDVADAGGEYYAWGVGLVGARAYLEIVEHAFGA